MARTEFGYYDTYRAVANANQGSFNNPRQKTWLVQKRSDYGWRIEKETHSYQEALDVANDLIRCGGMYMNINRVLVTEVVPIDTVITPR